MKHYKKIFILVLSFIYILLPSAAFAENAGLPSFFVRIPTQPYADSPYNESIFNDQQNTKTTYYVNGIEHSTSLPIITVNNKTLLPLRLVGEACGAEVVWDNNKQTASITTDKQTAVIQLNSSTMLINNKRQTLDTTPLLINDTIYLPLRTVGEALGKKVFWQNKLGQDFIVVCNPEQDFSSRSQFNKLLSQTYLKDMLATDQRQLLDVGQSAIISVDNDNTYYRNYIAINEAIAWHDFNGSFPEETAIMEDKLNCIFRYYDPPMPNAETLAAFYADGDVKIIYDVPPYYSFDAFIYGSYVYITEYHDDTKQFLRINLESPREAYFVPETITENDYNIRTMQQ